MFESPLSLSITPRHAVQDRCPSFRGARSPQPLQSQKNCTRASHRAVPWHFLSTAAMRDAHAAFEQSQGARCWLSTYPLRRSALQCLLRAVARARSRRTRSARLGRDDQHEPQGHFGPKTLPEPCIVWVSGLPRRPQPKSLASAAALFAYPRQAIGQLNGNDEKMRRDPVDVRQGSPKTGPRRSVEVLSRNPRPKDCMPRGRLLYSYPPYVTQRLKENPFWIEKCATSIGKTRKIRKLTVRPLRIHTVRKTPSGRPSAPFPKSQTGRLCFATLCLRCKICVSGGSLKRAHTGAAERARDNGVQSPALASAHRAL